MLYICDKSSIHTFMGLFLTLSLVLSVYLSFLPIPHCLNSMNPCPLHWKHDDLTTGPPGKFILFLLL